MDNPEKLATQGTQDIGPIQTLCTLDHFLNMSVNYGITARIVTGLSIFTKTEILYRETGCELLSVRRKRK